MRKLNVVFLATTVLFLVLNIVQFIVWRNINVSTAKIYTDSIADLNATIEAYGPDVTVYTVNHAVKSGDFVTEDNLVTFTIPGSVDNEQYVHNASDIVDRVYKIAINPGTPITTNMTMAEVIEDDMRDRDITLDRITVGLKVGDYIDIRITMPYGDDYVVMSHKRIYGLGDNTIKLYLTEAEWMTYQGAMIDYYLNEQYGCTIYGDRYIEPGLQQAAVRYYAVPTNIAKLVQKDPNIIDKKSQTELNTWRSSIEELLVIFRDEEDTVDSDGSKFSAGRDDFNTKVNADYATDKDNTSEGSDDSDDGDFEDEMSDDYWESDLGESTEEAD